MILIGSTLFLRLCLSDLYRLVVPAHQARPGAPLAPVLGQIQIKVQDFILEFNKQCAPYEEEIPLPCRVIRHPQPNKFSLEVMPPTFFTLLWGQSRGGRLSVVDLNDCFLFRRGRPPKPIELRELMGTLQSCVGKNRFHIE